MMKKMKKREERVQIAVAKSRRNSPLSDSDKGRFSPRFRQGTPGSDSEIKEKTFPRLNQTGESFSLISPGQVGKGGAG